MQVIFITEKEENLKGPDTLSGLNTSEPPMGIEGKPDAKAISHQEPKLLETKHSAKIKELEEQVRRISAEFDNYRKRTAKDMEAVRDNSSADVYLKFIPIIDEFDLALIFAGRSSSTDKNEKEFVRGFEMIYSKVLDLLKREGVEEMVCINIPFDPYKHDAIRADKGEDGKIIEVVQKGYTYRGKVLRHAKVIVGNGTGE